MKIHILGICGTFMGGLARILVQSGHTVSGSDYQFYPPMSDQLEDLDLQLISGYAADQLPQADLYIIGNNLSRGNESVEKILDKNFPYQSGPRMLGSILQDRKVVAISGTHGKTTTTSILSNILNYAKLDPTIINGGVLNSIGSSAKLGKSDWSLVESDESDGSFLQIPFNYSIITNIDNEHLDYYRTMKNLKNKFIEFIDKTPSFGKAFLCLDDKNVKNILPKIKNNNYYTFGLNKKSNFHIFNIIQNKDYSKFNIKIKIPGKTKIIKNISIPLLGLHNIKNATSALAVAFSIGVSDKIIKLGLKNFNGVQRRFNFLFEINKVPFFDDYAHHPTEISSVLDGVSKVYNKEEIVCIFQPHRISRVKNLKIEFSKCFKNANTVLLCPIYKASETIKLGFPYTSFAKLIAKNSKVNLIMLKNEIDLKKITKNIAFGNKIFIAMGAGSITNWVRNLN